MVDTIVCPDCRTKVDIVLEPNTEIVCPDCGKEHILAYPGDSVGRIDFAKLKEDGFAVENPIYDWGGYRDTEN